MATDPDIDDPTAAAEDLAIANPPATPTQPASAQQAALPVNQKWEPAPNTAPVLVGSASPDASTKPQGTLKDFGDEVWASTLQMGEGVLGTVSYATRQLTQNPDAVQFLEQQKRTIENHVQATISELSPDAQHAMHASIFGGQDEDGEHIPTPGEVGWKQYLGASLASMVPQIALAVLPGSLAARVVTRVASEAAGTAARVAATGGAFGTLQAGDAYNEIVSQVDKAKPEELAQSPVYQELRGQGLSDIDARKQMVAKVAPVLAASQFVVGAATGAGAGALLTGGAAGAAGRGLLARTGVGAAEGALTMGVQAGGGEALQENAQQQAGLTQGFDSTKLAHAFASGALGGVFVGGVGGALHGGAPDVSKPVPTRDETQENGPDTSMVADPAMQSALNTQLKMPLDQAPPDPVRGAPQGELSRTADQANATGATPPAAAPAAEPPTPPSPTAVPSQGATATPAAAGLSQTVPEPKADMIAQLRAVGDPNNPKDTAFIPAGGMAFVDSVRKAIPANATVVSRRGVGRLITTDPQKAEFFRTAKTLGDDDMAELLGYPESKTQVIASGSPTVVQGRDAQGNVVHESAASPEGVPAAAQVAAATVPGGTVHVLSPEEALTRRVTQPPETPVDEAASKAAEPTPAQAEAGNYQKGHVNIGGLDVSVETPKGGVRRGVGPDGTPWEATMPAHYGYIRKTEGADGDHVDVALGPQAHEADQHPAYVIDQKDPATGKFDEHKSFVGFDTPIDAIKAYDGSFSDGSGPSRRGALTQMPFDKFKEWVRSGDTTKPLVKPTVSDQLKTRLAAQKAKMAAPGEARRGQVTTVESETPLQTSGREPRTHAEAMDDLHDAGEVAGRMLVPLKKGTDLGPIMSKIGREIADRLGKTKTESDIHEAVARWGRADPNPIPGTRTRRFEIADKILQLMTGKSLDEFSGRSQRLRSELAREPQPPTVYESEGHAAGEPLTTVGEAGAERTRSETSTDKTRVLGDLLDDVLNGHKTVQEAHAEYGTQAPGRGRPRKFATFSDYLDDRIAHAEDPATTERLRDMLTRTDRLNDQAKSAETERIEKLLAETGKEHADRLRELKAELDPVGEAVQEAAPKKRSADILRERLAARRAQPEPFGRIDNSYARVLADPRLSRPVDALLADNKPRSVHDYLSAIASDEVVRAEAPAMAALARRLRTIVHPDVEVRPGGGVGDAGTFWQNAKLGTGSIEIDPGAHTNRVETLLHEALHSVTSHYIESLPAGHPDRLALDAMGAELHDAGTAAVDRGELGPAAIEDITYALSNPHELHTMLMSNPYLQQLAANHVPSAGFRIRMRELGYPLQAAKSVWSAFTAFLRRTLGLKGVATESESSLLDHILRPIQDITDRAAEFNRRGAGDETDPVLQAYGRRDIRDTGRDILDKIDPAGLGDKGRRFTLMGATTDGIVKWNHELFQGEDGNSLEQYRTATEAVAARSKQFHDDHADEVVNLLKKIQGPDRDKLAALMNDATIANVRLGPKADNSHIPAAQQTRLDALQRRYSALSAPAREAYTALRDYYGQTYREERDAQIAGLIKTVLPNATDTQRKAITEAARTKAGIESMVNDTSSDVSKAFGDAWSDSRKLVKGIGQVHAKGFVQGDYFPLRRFGDYVVSYGSKGDEDYGVEMFERRSEAETRRAELTKQGADNVSQVMDKRVSKMRNMLPDTTVVDELNAAMRGHSELSEHADEVRDLVNSILMQHATHSETARASMRRRGVQGASTNIERVLARDFLATASRVGYLEHGPERYQALADMRRHANSLDGSGQQIRAQAVLHELEQRMPSGDDASGALTGLARRFSTLGFVQSLMSPSHMLTSSIEAHMNSTALLGARHGSVRAGLALTKALKDVSPVLAKGVRNTIAAVGKGLKAADWNLSNVVRDRLIANGADRANMIDLFNRLNAAGLIDHTMVREIQRIANPGADVTRGWWNKFLDLNAAGAHAVDVASKTAIAKAAYDLELRRSGNHETAARYAVETARQAMPNYNVANKARISTAQGPLGGFAGPLTQFKQYGIHMYSMMANLVHTWQHGATPAERREARRAFAGVLATHTMIAGALTLIGDPLRWIGGAYDFITGADKPHDYENDVRGWISDAFGPELGEIIARGVPHAAGIDIHRRVGLNNLLEPPELKSFDKAGFVEAAAAAMTGAAGEDATVLAGGMSKMLHGDLLGGLKDLVPRVIRDPMKAIDLANKGVTDSRGKTILAPSKISTGNVAAQALGFQPARVSEFREGRFAVQELQQAASSERTRLITSWVGAHPDDRSAAMTDVRHFNQAHPGQPITLSQLLQAQARQRKAARQPANTFGLKMTPAQSRTLSPAGRFANVQ